MVLEDLIDKFQFTEYMSMVSTSPKYMRRLRISCLRCLDISALIRSSRVDLSMRFLYVFIEYSSKSHTSCRLSMELFLSEPVISILPRTAVSDSVNGIYSL